MFSPESLAKTLWDMMIFLLIVWQAIHVPFKLSFEVDTAEEGILNNIPETIADICFTIDIVLAFNTGYYKNGVLILNRRLIIADYLKSWFILDIISTFPYSMVV